MRFRVAFIFSLSTLRMAHSKRQPICDIILQVFLKHEVWLTADMRKKIGARSSFASCPKV